MRDKIFSDSMETLAQRLRNEGKEIGYEEGIRDEKRETARRMLGEGFPIETVIKCTGLTEKQVKSLLI